METQTERTDLETWCGKERMRGMEEEHENLDVTICKIGKQRAFAGSKCRSSNPVLCDNLKEWDGMGGGREV